MRDLRSWLRARPKLHSIAMMAHQKQVRALRVGHRLTARRAVRHHDQIWMVISQEAGLGGLLLQAASALEFGTKHNVGVALRLESANYAPRNWSGDWLDCYFERLSPVVSADAPHVVITDLVHPHAPHLDIDAAGALVWSNIAIRKDIEQLAAPSMVGRYAAVHFRGSDKAFEAPRVRYDTVFGRLETELSRTGIERVFVASDEEAFLDAARSRWGDRVFTLPQQAHAVDGRPPHLTDVPGDIKAREALSTMLVLSGAELLVRTESFLSAWATTLSKNQQHFLVTAAG